MVPEGSSLCGASLSKRRLRSLLKGNWLYRATEPRWLGCEARHSASEIP